MFVATRYATKKSSSSNFLRLHSREWSLFCLDNVRRIKIEQEGYMENGHFYYISDEYFEDFPDQHLMKNKETVEGQVHDRPCFYAFRDDKTGLYWMIPFSSQVTKFRRIYAQKMQKYNHCDTIVFGEVMGHEKAFLIQNMCPVTENYIKNEYYDSHAHIPVRINGQLEKELKQKANKILALQRKGIKLIFPDVLEIEQKLLDKRQ